MGSDRAHRRAAHRRGGRDRAWPATPAGVALLDDVTLSNCGVKENATVVIAPATVYGARQVQVSGSVLATQSIPADTLRQALLGKVVSVGDAVSLLPRDLGPGTSTAAASQALSRTFGVAWTSELLTVTEVEPAGPVSVQPNTAVGWGSGTARRPAPRPEHPRGRAETGRGAARRSRRGRSTGREAARMAVAGAGRTGSCWSSSARPRGSGYWSAGPRGVGKATLARSVLGRSARRRWTARRRGDRGGVAAARGLGGRRVGRVRWRAADLRHRRAAAGQSEPVATLIIEHCARRSTRGVAFVATTAHPDGSTHGCATRSCATANCPRPAGRREPHGRCSRRCCARCRPRISRSTRSPAHPGLRRRRPRRAVPGGGVARRGARQPGQLRTGAAAGGPARRARSDPAAVEVRHRGTRDRQRSLSTTSATWSRPSRRSPRPCCGRCATPTRSPASASTRRAACCSTARPAAARRSWSGRSPAPAADVLSVKGAELLAKWVGAVGEGGPGTVPPGPRFGAVAGLPRRGRRAGAAARAEHRLRCRRPGGRRAADRTRRCGTAARRRRARRHQPARPDRPGAAAAGSAGAAGVRQPPGRARPGATSCAPRASRSRSPTTSTSTRSPPTSTATRRRTAPRCCARRRWPRCAATSTPPTVTAADVAAARTASARPWTPRRSRRCKSSRRVRRAVSAHRHRANNRFASTASSAWRNGPKLIRPTPAGPASRGRPRSGSAIALIGSGSSSVEAAQGVVVVAADRVEHVGARVGREPSAARRPGRRGRPRRRRHAGTGRCGR